MFLVVRTPRKTVGPVSHIIGASGDIKERLERLESPLPVLACSVPVILGIRLALHWKLRTLDYRVVASRAQWRFGIFTVGLQMAMKLNQVK